MWNVHTYVWTWMFIQGGYSCLRKQLLRLLETMLDSHLGLTSEYKCSLQFTTEAAFGRSKETL